MENRENARVVTLKAGEQVLLKAEDGAVISEVKKPKRNTAKEREWEKEKYHRFTFLVDKQQAQKFIGLLDETRPDLEDKKRPLLWFREQITSFIGITLKDDKNTLNVDRDDTFNEISDLKAKVNDLEERLKNALKANAIQESQGLATFKSDISKAFSLDYADFHDSKNKEYNQNTFDVHCGMLSRIFKKLKRLGISFDTLNDKNDTLKDAGYSYTEGDNLMDLEECAKENAPDKSFNEKCVICGTLNRGYVDGRFKCIECERWNYDPTGETDEDNEIETDDEEETYSLNDSVENVPAGTENNKPTKQPTKPPITPEIIMKWAKLNAPADGSKGMSFAKIAKSVDGLGYDSSTISRNVKKRIKQDGES